jgi:transcriptional regulator GlxA family with amidase domain
MVPTLRCLCVTGRTNGAEALPESSALSRRTVIAAIHPRVRKLLSLLRDGRFEGDASLEVLAEAVGLSPSRLMHVFTESIGIPLRPYLSWLRLQRAAAAIVSGKASLTEAAPAAGFADAAHMSRSFKRALGVAPSVLRPLRCSGQSVQDT